MDLPEAGHHDQISDGNFHIIGGAESFGKVIVTATIPNRLR
jgi:hypothetical protein